MALADEQAWFDKNRAYISKQYPGKFVLVKNLAVQGSFTTYDQAYKAGAQRWGAAGEFLVKQALPQEPQAII